MRALTLLKIAALFLLSCGEITSKHIPVIQVESVPGQITVFNSCGVPSAAEEVNGILRANGFDVLSAQTDPQWSNYEETIVAIRNPHWAGHSQLKAIIDTKNFIVLQDTLNAYVNATIFLGKDYKKVFGKSMGEK
jgi:hypothetical protein